MWESRGFCEISKERWEEGKSCFWISTLSTTPPFPQLFFSRRCPPSCLHLSITFSPRMVRLRRRRHPSRLSRSGGRRLDSRTRRDLLVAQSPATVTDLQLAVFPFAYHHPALGRRIPALPFYLEESTPMSHHPVVADGVPRLQPECLVQFRPARPPAVIILPGCGRPREPFVVLG